MGVGSPMWLALVGFALAADPSSSLYEDLYRHGYHSDLKMTHARDVLRALKDGTPSVLDVGCSHGLAVQELWRRGIEANGVDISPTAVRLATKARSSESARCGDRPCFQVATATALPFPNKSFHTIMSTDVLEHIIPSDVEKAVSELVRVTQSQMWLKIAVVREHNTAPLKQEHELNRHKGVTSLHATVMPLAKWAAFFRKHSEVLRADIERGMLHVTMAL